MAPPDLNVRPTTSGDVPTLRQALAWAIEWRSSCPGPADHIVRDTGHEYLLSEWGRAGDMARVAEADGKPVGAAWLRFWTASAHSYGYVDPQTPELGVGVDPALRGQGVGTALLGSLLEGARAEGITRVSLSVERDNPAMHLYERLGFERYECIDESWTMVAELEE